MGKELDSNYYNDGYKIGGHNQMYFKEAEDIDGYYVSWKKSYDLIKEKGVKKVVDLGCGPGHFASLFSLEDNIEYIGYDFSEVAINQAIERNNHNSNSKFIVKDLKDITLDNNTFYVSFEFLEHVSFDLEILSKLNKGDEILFSVPSYDSQGHVRFFKTTEEIEDRYGDILSLTNLNTHAISPANKVIYLYYGVRK